MAKIPLSRVKLHLDTIEHSKARRPFRRPRSAPPGSVWNEPRLPCRGHRQAENLVHGERFCSHRLSKEAPSAGAAALPTRFLKLSLRNL